MSRLGPYAFAVAALLSCFVPACRSSNEPANRIVTPRATAFEELFVFEDTVHLDASVLIGRIDMLDVNSLGELLVYDRQGRAVHEFTPQGVHIRTLQITDCNPEASFGFRAQARYLDDARVIALTTKGAMVFDPSGQCVHSSTDAFFVTSAYSVCLLRDTVFVMTQTRSDSALIRTYTPELAYTGQLTLPPTRFPKRAAIMNPNQGRTMGCFADDVWWVYGEDFDARPRLERSARTRYQPGFYRERTQDYPDMPTEITPANFREVNRIVDEAEEQASAITGIYELGESTRMIVYDAIATEDAGQYRGVLIVNHDGEYAAASARAPESISAAKYGKLYLAGEPEELPNGALPNPPLLRYRFMPPRN